MSVLSSNSTSIFHKGCLLQGRSSLYSSRLLKADSTHVQLEAPSFSSFPFHDFCHSAYWSLHCNPLQDLYWVELLHMEIPVVITGNGVAVYNFFYVLVTFFPCFINIKMLLLVPVMCTGNCQIILQGLKGCFDTG